ncbi:hypothetical protein V5799_020001 [Amblyomma americanum]|uniref:Uncharacterized protein n=1 Tax=Amblyomma americanum TaxID=6943 RepID=A0AAQ4EVA2_AMBAM
MSEEAKSPEPLVPRPASAEDKILADAKGKKNKATLASKASSAVPASLAAKNQSQPMSPHTARVSDERGYLAASQEVPAPSRGQPDAPEDRGGSPAQLSALKTVSRKRHKHRRSSHKAPRGPDDKTDAAGHAGTAHVKRRKSRVVEGGLHLNKDHKPVQVPIARPSQADDAPTLKPEGSVSEDQGLKPIEVIPIDGADTRTRGSHIPDEARQEEFGHSVASATVETEREAEDGTVTAGGASKTIWSSNATAKSEVGSTLLAPTSGGKVNGGFSVPTETEVAADAEVNADTAPPSHAEVGGTDTEVRRDAESNVNADVDAALKGEGAEHGIDGKAGIMLAHQTRRRSSAAVKIMAPEPECEQRGPRSSDASGATGRSSRGSKAARPGRVPCRKSDGDLRSLYSLVALKDLASTIST